MTDHTAARAIVVGAGLAGLAIAALLCKAGFRVVVAEARSTPETNATTRSSVNLALSTRGMKTLDELGLLRQVLQAAVPMYGRRLHFPDGREEFQPYDHTGERAIYSIRRANLWHTLFEHAKAAGAEVRCDTRCNGVNLAAGQASLVGPGGVTSQHAYDVLIGADGVNSAVRQALVHGGQTTVASRWLQHGFIELEIRRDQATQLEADALHIWARDDQLMIALPNSDRSFTGTLFFPFEPEKANDPQSERAHLSGLILSSFPETVALIHGWPDVLCSTRIGRILTVGCEPWTHGGRVVLIGDAAHAMPPFYGQGMNCALEDCSVLMRCIAEFHQDMPAALAQFERTRRPDTDAVTALSEANYDEMSRRAFDPNFVRRRDVERALQQRFPAAFVPLYSMISFSTLPYAQALERSIAQTKIVDRLLAVPDGSGKSALETDWVRRALNEIRPL